MKQKENKPAFKPLNKFIINYFKLNKNKYTQNDYLFLRKFNDFTVAYNPRCQLLDFSAHQNNSRSYYHMDEFYYWQCKKIIEISKKVYEDLSYSFFLETGKVLDDYIHCRLHGLRCKNASVDYITEISNGTHKEWSEVENWEETSKQYKKDKYFKYAFFGTWDKNKKILVPNKKEEAIGNKTSPVSRKNLYRESYDTWEES